MSLTIKEKRDKLFNYCDNTACNVCLNKEHCLDIEEATEEELDKALELINNTKIKPLEDSKTEKHKLICEKINKLEDKLNRLKSLNFSRSIKVKDESIEDTLMDLAKYAIMTLIELEGEE